MNPVDLQELAALDAVGALDADEQAAFRVRLADATPDERVAVAAMFEAASGLAVGLPLGSPAPRVRAALMEKVSRQSTFSVGASEGQWVETPIAGIVMKLLSLDRERNSAVMLLRARPGTTYPAHHHTQAEECYVVSGDITVQGRTLHAGGFHHAEPDTDHDMLSTEFGAEVLLVVAASDYGLL